MKTVRTITRPTGEIIEDLYVDHQLGLMSEGLGDATGGLDEVKKGLTEVQGGLDQVTGMFSTGSAAEVNGAGLAQAAGGIGQLSAGVGASTKGLDEIGSGLGELSASLKEMSESDSVRATGLFIPSGTLSNETFKPVIDRYTFGAESGILLEVILDYDPYSREAIQTVHDIKDSVTRSVIGTPFFDAELAYSGVSSMNSDLYDISSKDFKRTVIIMLASLFVVLTFLFRSAIMPLYMIWLLAAHILHIYRCN